MSYGICDATRQLPLDLVLTDYAMPGRNGWQLVQDIAKRWPLTKCILASGYLEEEERAEEAVDRPAASSVMMIGVPEGGAKIIAGDAPTLPEPLPPGDRPGIPYFSMAEVEEMLHIMQRLDPPGVCARDLRECLLIQLEERKDTGSLTYRLVKEAFPDLIAHRWNELGRRFGTEPLKVQTAADQLARLDPKTGLKHSAGGEGYVIPDLVVEKVEGQYRVFLNDTGVPRLRLSRSYKELARDKKKFTAEHREFIASRMNSANWLIQAADRAACETDPNSPSLRHRICNAAQKNAFKSIIR